MKSLLALALFFSFPALADRTFISPESPDGQLTAHVAELRNNEIFVTLTNKSGKQLAVINLQSQDAEHGRTLAKAEWSKDSRFFLFTTQSSGGHSPWHTNAYFFSRASETFRSVDDRSGLSVASTEFTIDASDVVAIKSYDFSRGEAVPAFVNLPNLDRVQQH